MKLRLNKNQVQALEDIDHPVILSAGAGTGKTAVLTQRYIHILREGGLKVGQEVDQILAITFTKKAAGEMRDRIIEGLSQEDLPHRDRLLRDMNRAQIQTMDSFCKDLLQEFGLGLGINPGFGVLEEGDQEKYLKEAVQAGIKDRLKKDSPLFYFLKDLDLTSASLEGPLIDLIKELRTQNLKEEDLEEKLGDLAPEVQPYYQEVLALTRDIRRILWERKKKEGVLDFSDLLIQSLRLMEREDIRREVQDRYRHILIDEFQDTNRAQIQLFFSLAGEDSRLFLVGDKKQAIYGFRGSDIQASKKALEDLRRKGARDYSLVDNYRTAPGLMDKINGFFAPRMEDYQALIGHGQVGQGPDLSIYPLPLEAKASQEERIQKEAQALVKAIRALAGDYGLGDMALLLRRRTHQEAFTQALKAADIPFIQQGQGGLLKTQEIVDLLSALDYILNEEDTLARLAYYRSPLVGLKDDSLFALEEGEMAWLDKEDLARYKEAEALRRAARDLAGAQGARPVLDFLYKELDYPTYLLGLDPQGQKYENALAFLDLASTYDKTQGLGLRGFRAYLRDLETYKDLEEAQLGGGGQALTISTIHGAKGLEYPVVFLADLGYKTKNQSPLFNLSLDQGLGIRGLDPQEGRDPYQANRDLKKEEEEAEALRLFYVAMTRAKEKLFLILKADGVDLEKDLVQAFPDQMMENLKEGQVKKRPASPQAYRTYKGSRERTWKKPLVTASKLLERTWEKEEGQGAEEPKDLDFRPLVIGNVLHDYARQKGGQGGDLEELLKRGQPPLKDKEVSLVKRMVANYQRTRKTEEIVATEVPFRVEFEDFIIQGTLDQWRKKDGEDLLIDLKTNLSGASKDSIAHYRLQLLFYGLAWERLFGKPPKLALIYLSKGERVLIDYDREEVLGAIRTYLRDLAQEENLGPKF
ncbi:MAG: UvrD-helicase domain-containing protein [Tissierellia bacterium]|nr:UvrD-helicase domain-containing protein [Tissierellia bacterium]